MTRPAVVAAFVLGAWVALGLREVLSRTWLNRTPAEAQRVAAMDKDGGAPTAAEQIGHGGRYMRRVYGPGGPYRRNAKPQAQPGWLDRARRDGRWPL